MAAADLWGIEGISDLGVPGAACSQVCPDTIPLLSTDSEIVTVQAMIESTFFKIGFNKNFSKLHYCRAP